MPDDWVPARAAPVFVDRDGTLIVERKYLSDPHGVTLEEGAIEGLGMLCAQGHPLFVLSNQSGIGRGLFTLSDARRVNDRAAELLLQHGIAIVDWYLCPHAPEENCSCRKPAAGMARFAARDWNVSLEGCYMIGDKRSDLELADVIGGTGILVTTGHGLITVEWALAARRPVCANLLEAAAFIATHKSPSRS